jgi:hypothetical protein
MPGLRDPGSNHRAALAHLQLLWRLVLGSTRPLVQVTSLPGGGPSGVAAMSDGRRGHEPPTFLAARCRACDGNGVHPEAYDEHGDPQPRLRNGFAYFYNVKCEVCDGTGKHTAQLREPYSGGDA